MTIPLLITSGLTVAVTLINNRRTRFHYFEKERYEARRRACQALVAWSDDVLMACIVVTTQKVPAVEPYEKVISLISSFTTRVDMLSLSDKAYTLGLQFQGEALTIAMAPAGREPGKELGQRTHVLRDLAKSELDALIPKPWWQRWVRLTSGPDE